jgi:hypothetical protein
MGFIFSTKIHDPQRALTTIHHQKEQRGFKIGAFDVETGGLKGEAVVMTQLCHEMWPEPLAWETIEEALDYLFNRSPKELFRTIWYSHNAEFDWRYMVFPIKQMFGDRFLIETKERAEGTIYELKIYEKHIFDKGGNNLLVTTFRDSMALFPQSLAKFTGAFAPQHAKQDIGLGRGVKFDNQNPVHVEYAKNDVVALIVALINFDKEVYRHYGVHIKGTTASTAFAAWQMTIPEGEFHDRLSAEAEAFIRKCYYGGLVQLNAPVGVRVPHVTTLDRNSSYPAAMRLGVPFGDALYTTKFVNDLPGYYRVTAHVPRDAILPIVPHRNDDGAMCWPTGNFQTYLSSMEIAYTRGLGITYEIHEGYYFPDGLKFCFNDFVDKCEALRGSEGVKGTPTETVVKLMQNSVYGRFGMKPEGREGIISFDGCPDGYEPFFNPDSGEINQFLYMRRVERQANYMLPHYAAWITAGARIAIDEDTEALGRSRCLYRDTDSIALACESVTSDRIGPRYGQLKNEGLKYNVMYIGPKAYSWEDYKGGVWSLDGRLKGIPSKSKTQEFLAAVRDGTAQPVPYTSVTSFEHQQKTGVFSKERVRSVSKSENVYGHRIESGVFRPRHLEEI